MNAFLPWLGGKRRLASVITGQLGRIPHTSYVEPFCGAGHVFFRKAPVESEVLSDRNLELMILYRVVQRHCRELLRAFRWALVSRTAFEALADTPPELLTDVQRAARFLTLQKLTFGGMPGGRSFGVQTTGRPKLNLDTLPDVLGAAAARLSGVRLEHRSWEDCLARHDSPDTLFYLDPPYWDCEADYGPGLFASGDFARLSDALRDLRGQFVLSLNDVPEVRALFSGFHLQAVTTRYTVSARSNATLAAELLISNAALAN